MPVLHQYMLDPEAPAQSIQALDQQYRCPNVVATTCLSINEFVCIFVLHILAVKLNITLRKLQGHFHAATIRRVHC